jgi:hypothetical protein
VRYNAPGPQLFVKPVEAAWLVKDGDNIVKMELDKVFIAERDKVELGLTLVRAGFIE